LATLKKYAQMNFLHGVSAGWVVPLIGICVLGSLVYFLMA